MKIRKITLILLATFLLICSLSTISAANNTISDTSTGGILQGIVDTGDGDTLYLNPGTYNKTNQDTNITISKNITIQGNGSANQIIIDAKGLSRIFVIANNTNITVINITFINANLNISNAVAGGAIFNYYSSAMIAVINCTFINGSSSGAGGAIMNVGNNAIITNCTFIDNVSRNSGGAIMNVGNNTMITNCVFINNMAEANSGGAIGNNGANLLVNNCTFINSRSFVYGGGAIWTNGNNLTINDSIFTNNTVNGGSGGAITNLGNNSVVHRCIFTNNTVNGSGGGAITNLGNNVTVTNNTFINNVVNGVGGSIFNRGHMFISNNIMSGNTAGLGQMIYNNGTMGILNLTFINNSTWIVRSGSTYTIYATLTDDMGNTVTCQEISFYVNGILGGVLVGTAESIEGYANFTFTVIGEDGDLFPVNGIYTGIGDYSIIINEGLLRVEATPFNITLTPTNSTITAKNTFVGKLTTIKGIATDKNRKPLANTKITVTIDGKDYSVTTNSVGEWNLDYTPTKAGNIVATVKWNGNSTHTGFTNMTTFNVAKRNIIVTITTEENDDGSITIIANATYEDDGSPVINHPVDFILDGKIIGTGITNKNGIAKLQIPANKINGKTHKITALVYGDDNSNNGKATTTFTRKNPNNPNPKKTSNNPAATAAMKETGIPINLIILVLLSCLGIIIRKKQ